MLLRDDDGEVEVFISFEGARSAALSMLRVYTGVRVEKYVNRGEMQGYCIHFGMAKQVCKFAA